MENNIIITENAAKQIQQLITDENANKTYFRIKVDGGGCAGFQYNFTFTDTKESQDYIFDINNIKVIIDDISLKMINGSTLDYETELIGSSFKIKNPQATSSCGCGTSFSL